ncbi:MAG: fibronectin type III domain-containing protein [Ruminiclostridium sp.]
MKTKRMLAAVLALTLFVTSYSTKGVSAADIPIQPAPSNLAITPLNPNTQPPIGYSASDGGESGYYADMGWEVANPNLQGISFAGKYVNIYLEESARGYRAARTSVIKDMPGDTTPIRMRNLKSGTVYKANAKAYYEYTDGVTTNRIKSPESASSNTVKFLTDINLQCLTMGTDKIKIIWDDVWNEGKRISYKLYISQNKDFTNTFPIYINEDQISEEGPVILNRTDGTLEYVHNVSDSGRVFYVKIVPEISDTEIIRSVESQSVLTSTYILVKTTRMSTTNDGSIIWRLDWSPVVTGISSSNIKVKYYINKYNANNVPETMFVEDSTTTFITVPPNEPESSYMIRAEVTQNGLPYYPPNVTIISDKVTLKEDEVSSTPARPELVPEFKDLGGIGDVIISYEDILDADGNVVTKGELGKDTATVLWRVPHKGDGTIDANVLYDIWLIEDPNTIDTPAAETKIESAFIPKESNYVRDVKDNNNIIGYKYKLEGLLPNHTYYFKIVAKKVFTEEVDGIIQNIERISTPALKVIITLSGGAIDTPLLPSNPPLKIREEPNGKKVITATSVTIQTKNRWYEKFNSATGKWSYVKADKDSLTDTDELYNPIDIPPDMPPIPPNTDRYRRVSYQDGVSLYVGCVEYVEGIDITKIDTYKLEKVPTLANDDSENPELNAPENSSSTTGGAITPSKHNVVIPINELKPNTTYILWVRAARDGDPTLFSDVSNPLIFTTLPSPAQIVEKPVVPTFNYTFVADTYVDLGWNYKDGVTYYIKYGTVDDPSKAGNTVTVTTSQIKESGVDYLRIPGLKANTQYYFWIQAEAFSEDQSVSKKSDWSDSLPLRTLKDIPPATPRGFGVKNTADAVTKNSVTFEWIKEPNLEYILEVAGGVDYKDLTEYKAGAVSEFKVEGLKSNFRYFARLYAYDPAKKLTSLPTQSVSVRTLRSSDDYDSDQDVNNVISGEFIDKATTVVNGTWVIKIVGVNADRLIEVMNTDNKLDYTVDVSKPPSAAKYISIYVSKKVFDKLEQLKENIAFKTSTVAYNFKAGILSNYANTADTRKEQIYLFSITLSPQQPAANANELLLRQPLAEMGATLDTGASNIPISEFAKPLVVKYPYSLQKDYVEGKTSGYIYNTIISNWEKQTSSNQYDVDNNSGIISIQSQTPGLFGVADRTNNLFDDIYGHEYETSIINVALIHKLKSVTGRMFEPDKNVTIGEAIRLVFDTLDYSYGSEYMESAAKAGFTKLNKYSGTVCTRQEAACLATVLYEKKSSTKAKGDTDSISNYSDYAKIDKDILNKVTFAVENGFVPNVSSSKLNPTEPVTRGELMYMLEKALALAGELE